MEGDVLAKIIQTEREIQVKVGTAREICRERIETARKEAEAKIAQEESLIREQCRNSIEEAEALAREKAAARLEAEAQRAEKLKGLNDGVLKKIIMKHLVRILPGDSHDHAHVQN